MGTPLSQLSQTFEEWARDGYRVKRGEHAYRRGLRREPLFTFSQVEEDPYHYIPPQPERKP